MDKAGQRLLDVIKASKESLDFLETQILSHSDVGDSVAAFLDEKQNHMTAIQQWMFTNQMRLMYLLSNGDIQVITAMEDHLDNIERSMLESQ
jgi:hypothetical protein